MRSDELPVAILAVVAMVAVIPAVTHYVGKFWGSSRNGAAMLASIALITLFLLFLTSWVKPELSGPALGVMLLASVMVMAPFWWTLIDMGAAGLTDHPLGQILFKLAIPVLVLSYVISLGKRRMSAG